MKAVILAAGQSKRFWPLNLKHKGLFKIMGRPLIFYTIENLRKAAVKEIIIVQGPKKEIEREFKSYKFKNIIKYVVQEKPLGTGDALKRAKNFLKDKFLVLNGDDYYSQRDIKKCKNKKFCILLKSVPDPQNFGQVIVAKNKVKKLVEKPKKEVSSLVNIGLYFLDKSIFNFQIKKSKRGEYELVDFLKELIKKNKLDFETAEDWIPISYPWDLFNLNEFLLSKIERKILGKIEKGAVLKGKIIIGERTIIKSGTYIEGPVYIGRNCQIGPNCYLRKFTSIGDNCRIGQAVEIKNSIIGDNSKIGHLSYVGDSIIGENCNLGAGTIFANLRFDEKSIKVKTQGETIDSKRKKLGAILGEDVKTGINVSLMPGVLVSPNSQILPGTVLFKNFE
jgi:bifunctional UDP-N-acetylglucosamine pyrophosphorylase/glucosamine-1-phosphate N-acetyltransferase